VQGLSTHSKEQIHKVVGDLFDKAALRLLGPIPKLHHKKITLLGFLEGATLATLFIQAMNNKYLNNTEGDVLKGILGGAFGYIETLKGKTTSAISERIDGLAREARISKESIPEAKLNEIIQEELGKAKSGLETIAMSEATKARNLGALMDITRKTALSGNADPIIGFVGPNDDKTCENCRRLFFMPDGVTPRLWFLSECNGGYFKRGDSKPSILGLHPRCRHTPFNVPPDWGFDKSGHLTFVGLGYNALEEQRKKD
jgi:hypothetical protein